VSETAATVASGWQASLALRYAERAGRTVLVRREHAGPLVVQKAFYPEGDAVCHTIVVHPPGGIAGGDQLRITADVGPGAHALLTTPGAAKWYRSAGPVASQRVVLAVEAGASVEWLPQETIVFDRARVDMDLAVELRGDAVFFGWEILCLGRTRSGESFDEGVVRMATAVHRDGAPLWIERGRIVGADPLLASPVGCGGHPVSGTMLIAAMSCDDGLLAEAREVRAAHGRAGITRLPGLVVVRYLGDRAEAARQYFSQVWDIARPRVLERAASHPRIWRT